MRRSGPGEDAVQMLTLTVADTVEETDLVRSLRLVAADGAPLPAFTAGAHIRLTMPDGTDRPYSLVVTTDPAEASAPAHYRLGVRRDDAGAGGSRHMHALSVGDTLTATLPRNDFALRSASGPALLIAGGIGITPIASMAAALKAGGADYRLHYAGRSQGALAFLDELQAAHADRLSVHYDDDGSAIDLAGLIAADGGRSQIYVCGPRGMIEAVRECASGQGYAKDRVHFELFAAAATGAADESFEVELSSTGQVFNIPPGASIIDVLETGGVDLIYDCRRGDCGICQTRVIAGIPDHRDVILTEAERATNSIMQICVSRARSKRLVLDI